MPVWKSVCSAVLACASIGMALAGTLPDQARQAELTHLVLHDCGSCHGMTLKGGLGGALLPANLEHYSREDVAMFILDGIPGKPMPPWRGQLSSQDALWIAEQLKKGFAQ